jgi:alkylhydroperoxidase family enzyme
MIGTMMAKVDKSVIDAIRDGQSTGDDKTDALITFSVKLIQQRGWVSDSDKKLFFNAGFTEENALDVVLAASLKTLSNYTNHITGTKTNDEMKEFAWTKS